MEKNKFFIERHEEDGTNGIAFSETYFLNDNNESVRKEVASKIIIKEYDKDNKLITETIFEKDIIK